MSTFSPPPHTPYVWRDKPDESTALQASNLIAAENDLVDYTQQAVTAYDTFAETQFVHQDGTGLPSNVTTVGSTGLLPARQIPTMRPWLGLNGNDQPTGVFAGPQNLFQQVGISWTRHNAQEGVVNESGTSAPMLTNVVAADAAGFTSVVLLTTKYYNQSHAYITGSDITDYASWFVSQVQAVEAALPNRGTLYEIDNEPWNFYSPAATAAQYADVVIAVLNACQAANLDLTRIYPMAQSPGWITSMYTEQSTLKTLVQGWSLHPYGPPPPGFAGANSATNTTAQGIASVAATRQWAMASGADNILISEVGFQDQTISGTTSGSSQAAATSAQAAQWMSDLLELGNAYHQAGWLRALLIYHRTDTNWAMVVNNTSGTLTAQGAALVSFANRMRPAVNQAYAPRTPGIWMPYDDGYFATTMDPAAAKDAVGIVAGKVHFFRIRIDIFEFMQNLSVWVDTAGATLTSGQCFVGIYQKQLASGTGSYVLMKATADQSTNWTSTGRKTVAMTAGQNFVPGYYWIALLGNGTTMPLFRGVLNGAQMNFGNSGVLPQRVMQTTAATYTSLPASLDLSSSGTVSSTSFTSGILAGV